MPTTVNPVFAGQERVSLQQLPQGVNALLAQPVPNPARDNVPQQLALLKQEKVAILQQIVAKEQRIAALIQGFASAAAKAEEAARKSAAWGIVGAVVAVVVMIVISIIVAVFTFGAGAAQLAAVIEAQLPFLSTAAKGGHPLAGEFSAILSQMAVAIRNFLREREQDNRAAIARLLAELDRMLTRLERLPGPTAGLKGCCTGDPRAVFATGDSLTQSLTQFSALLQRVPREDVDTRPVISGLAAIQLNAMNALRTLAPKS